MINPIANTQIEQNQKIKGAGYGGAIQHEDFAYCESANDSAAANDADANAVHTPNDDSDVVADCEGKFKRLWRRFIPRASSSTSRGQKMGLILHRHYLNLHDHHAYNPHDDHHHFHIAGHPDAFKCNRRQTLNMDLISLLIFILIIILRSP